MAVPFARIVIEVVPELGRNDDAIAHFSERVCENRFPFTLPVRVGRIEERDAGVESPPQ